MPTFKHEQASQDSSKHTGKQVRVEQESGDEVCPSYLGLTGIEEVNMSRELRAALEF